MNEGWFCVHACLYRLFYRSVSIAVILTALIISGCAAAETLVFSETFDDGNWTTDPAWETAPADPSISISGERFISAPYSLKIAANNNMGAIRTASGLAAADQAFTCTFNLYVESIPEEAIPWCLQNASNQVVGLIFLLPSGKVQLTAWDPNGGYIRSDVPYPLSCGQWHSFKVTYDGAMQKLFIDGHAEPDAATSGAYHSAPAKLCIGNFVLPHTGTVYVDDLAISAEPGPPPAKVYVQFCSDTSTGGINTNVHYNAFPADDSSYTSPTGQAAQVMAESYRMSHLDSLGNPLKLTWYMNCGSVYSCGLETGPILPYELMMDNHRPSIARWGDEMAYHYHTWIWSDPNLDGVYEWNQAPEFTYCLEDFEQTVAHMVLDRAFYPCSFRSGWNWMSTLWESYLDEWFPYRFEGVTPSGPWTPYHPSDSNWQMCGEQSGWESAHQYIPSLTAAQVQTAFANALAGKPQVMTLWSHLKEIDFPAQIDAAHALFAAAHADYPTVEFEYRTGRECMLKWRGGSDVTPPALEIATSDDGPVRSVTLTFDEPIYQQRPFVALRRSDGVCSHIECSPAGANRWTFQFVPRETFQAAVAATDLYGNAVVRFLPLPLRMWGLTAKSSWTSEAEVEWQTSAPADTKVDYGPYLTEDLQTVYSAAQTLEHRATLTGLVPGTIYRVRVSSRDGFGQSVGPIETHILTHLADPLIIDNIDPGFSVSGTWSTGNTAEGRYGTDYRYVGTSPTGVAYADWTCQVTQLGVYDVSAWWSSGGNRSAAAAYVVLLRGTDYRKVVNQQTEGGQWNSLGRFRMEAGDQVTVRLLNEAPSGYVVIADAVKLERPFVPIPSIAAARLLSDGTDVEVSNVTVSGVFDGEFYVQDCSRAAGIKVRGSGVQEGQAVLLRGTLSTENAERILILSTVP